MNSIKTHYNHLIQLKKKYIKSNLIVNDIKNCIEMIMRSFDDFTFALTYSPFIKHNFMKKRNQAMLDNNKKD